MEMFDLSEMLRIAGLEKKGRARARNWTLGRPLKIDASVREARVPGSPAFYSREDIYLMALLDELWRSGLTAKALVRVHQALSKDIRGAFNKPETSALALRMRGMRTEMDVLKRDSRVLDLAGHRAETYTVCHIIDIDAIKSRIDQRITKESKGVK